MSKKHNSNGADDGPGHLRQGQMTGQIIFVETMGPIIFAVAAATTS